MAISLPTYFRNLKKESHEDAPNDLHRSIMGAIERFRKWRAFLVSLFSVSVAIFFFSLWHVAIQALEIDTIFLASIIWQYGFESIQLFEYPDAIMDYLPWGWALIACANGILCTSFYVLLRKMKGRTYAVFAD